MEISIFMSLETFTDAQLCHLFDNSRKYLRRRAMQLMHDDSYTGPQVCLNIIQPDSYIRPHLRYDDESIIWHSGKLISIQLEDVRNIKKVHMLSQDSPYLFLPNHTYHTVISLEEDSGIWMVVQGPYKQKFSEFLPETPTQDEDYHTYFEFLKKVTLNFNS